MKVEKINEAIDCCFRLNKQHAMLAPKCEECPYYDPHSSECVENLVKDIKVNLLLIPQLLFETHEQYNEISTLRSQIKPEDK